MDSFAPQLSAILPPSSEKPMALDKQIVEHLGDAPAVGDELVDAGFDLDVELDIALLEPLRHAQHRLFDHVLDLHR